MSRVVAIGNLKGGVGKTTLAISLAAAFAATRSVLLVDADPQRTASEWHGAGRLPGQAVARSLDDMAGTEDWVTAIKTAEAELVIIGLPPSNGPAVVASLMLADLVVVPCPPSLLDRQASAKLLAQVRRVRSARGGLRPFCLLVPSRVDRRSAVGRGAEQDLSGLGELIGPPVCQRIAFVEAAAAHDWVGAHAPGSEAHREVLALAGSVERLSGSSSAWVQQRSGHGALRLFR